VSEYQDRPNGGDTVPPSQAPSRRTRFSIIWLIPVVAVMIAGWMAYRGIANNGPEITVTFDTADGLTAGQTRIENKAVTLGTVESIALSGDMRRVAVKIRMNASTSNILTDHTRFWVVRPRINGASITGLETLLSGAYIAIDPGAPGGHYQTSFTGLESVPGVRSDQPGSTYTLVSPQIGSIGQGTTVYFRDVPVGEVLGYTMPPGGDGPILIQVFVKEPYDHYLRTDSRFWNVSGVQVGLGAGGLKVQMTSLQALFSGGVAFGLPERRRGVNSPVAPVDSVFKLYDSETSADSARYQRRVPAVTYVDSSVKGLAKGSQVTMFGIQVGTVSDVKLDLNSDTANARVRVDMDLEPERVLSEREAKDGDSGALLAAMVRNGLRASVASASLLTGESMISLDFVKNAKPETLGYENGLAVIPSQPGGFSGIMSSVSTVADKIAAMPLTQIGDHVNDLIAHSDKRINSPQVTQSLTALRDSLRSLDALTKNANAGMQPLMKRLPALTAALQDTLASAQGVLGSYGGDTDFHRDLQGMLVQLTQASRSIRLLTDYLDHHPSALITGRRN